MTVPGELKWSTSSSGAVQVVLANMNMRMAIPYLKAICGMFPATKPVSISDLFNGGEGCGKCFKFDYGGEGGTNPASAGSAIVQVTNSGAVGIHHLDCSDDALYQLTGIVFVGEEPSPIALAIEQMISSLFTFGDVPSLARY